MDNQKNKAPSFAPGERFRFIYPNYGTPVGLPEHAAHNGHLVTIVRPLSYPTEYENLGDPAYVVRADDGWIGEFVWESELHKLDYRWPSTHDQNGNEVHPPIIK